MQTSLKRRKRRAKPMTNPATASSVKQHSPERPGEAMPGPAGKGAPRPGEARQGPSSRTITLRNLDYQPSVKELEEEIQLDVPGDTIHEKAANLADAVLKPVNVKYQD